MSKLYKPTLELNWLELTYINSVLKNRDGWYDKATWIQRQVIEELICKIDDEQEKAKLK